MSKRNLFLLALAFLSLPACSSDAGSTADFVGDWSYSEGRATAVCGGQRASQDLNGMRVQISEVAPGEVEFNAGANCAPRLTVHGDNARAEAGAACEIAMGRTQLSMHFSDFALAPNAGSLNAAAHGSVHLSVPDGELDCDAAELEGVLQRVGPSTP